MPEISGYHGESVLTLVDLRDPSAWDAAGAQVAGWGREYVEIHRLDNDHVGLEFLPGGAADLRGPRQELA